MLLIALLWGCTDVSVDVSDDVSAESPPKPPVPAGPPTADVAAEPCAACHPEVVTAWSGSHHALAERALSADDDWARELGAERVIGVDPVVQALVPADGGRLQAHSRAFDPRPLDDSGFDSDRFPIFDDPREPGDWGHWTGGALTWNGRCAACHNTHVDKGYVPVAGQEGRYETTLDAIGIGCAACHGDASAHVDGGAPPDNPRMFDTCASCHARRAELTGEFRPGDAFLDHFLPLLLDDDTVFATDRRAIDEAFEWAGFTSSTMYAGGVRCGSCHDPHSGALLREGDALCTSCHGDGVAVHAPMEGACVDCHMPELTLMGRHARRDHGFTSPGAEGAQWGALDALDAGPRTVRASHLAALGDDPENPAARAALRNALEDADPLIRTAAASALVPLEAEDLEALQSVADDPVRAVRVGAQRALVEAGLPLSRAPDFAAYLDHNADDPRVRADRGAARLAAGDPGGLGDLTAAVKLDPTDPGLVGRHAVGLAMLGRPRAALEVLEAGRERFPNDVALAERLGLAQVGAGQLEPAATTLRWVVGEDPSRQRAWRNLALLYGQLEQIEEAKRAADRALRLGPDVELESWRAQLDAR